MATKHHEADRQGSCEHQPNRPPRASPERGRDHDGYGRQTSRPACDEGLNDVTCKGLCDQEKSCTPGNLCPSWIDSGGDHHREDCRQYCADIGDESRNRGEYPPQERTGVIDQSQARADEQPEKPALSRNCVRKKGLRRLAATSKAAVVFSRSLVPVNLMNRLRRSSRCSMMNTTKISTMPVVVIG